MGQQQLLLVILVTIIVGIATVVAINTFGTAADQANIDAVNNDVATLASAAQGYYMRPGMLGGGGRTFTGGEVDADGGGTEAADPITFEGLAFPSDDQDNDADDPVAVNENGRYIITQVLEQSFVIEAHPASCEGFTPGLSGSGCDEGGDIIYATVEPNDFSLGTGAPE